MEEGLREINMFLAKLNETFEIEAELQKTDNEIIADGLVITNLKNNGSEFLGIMHTMFNDLVQRISPEHEVIFDIDHGLVIARKVVVTDYIIEQF